jgi:hypothetical protein
MVVSKRHLPKIRRINIGNAQLRKGLAGSSVAEHLSSFPRNRDGRLVAALETMADCARMNSINP